MRGRLQTRRTSTRLTALLAALLVTGCGPREESQSDTVPEPTPPADLAGANGPANDVSDVAPDEDPLGRRAEPEVLSDDGVAAPADPPATAPPAINPSETSPPAASGPTVDVPTAERVSVENPGKGSERALFEGWPKPQLALFITGQQQGYIEPCGCTGLTNQKGGLARRHTLAKQLADRGWPLVFVDAGNQVRRYGAQAEIKFQVTFDGLQSIGYDAIAFGSDDLRLSPMSLAAFTGPTGEKPSPFVCANTAVLDRSFTRGYQVVERGGRRIGITAILGTDRQAKIRNKDILLKKPEEGLQEIYPQLKEQRCDLYVLLAHASIEESIKLAQQFPEFDVVVTAGGTGDPTYEPESIPGSKAILVQVGVKGMFTGVVGVFDDPQQPLRYQRVALDAGFKDSPEMLQLLSSYQQQLQTLGLSELGLKPIPHPSGKSFAGSEACRDCHSDESDIWDETPHAHALDSLVNPSERVDIPRHFDPECISCHVVGWDPQRHFPYTTGYLGLEETPNMHNVGCENCHGPGAKHVAAENGDVDLPHAAMEALREAMSLPLEQAERKCMECHDLDNSPDFHEEGAFEDYWSQVEH